MIWCKKEKINNNRNKLITSYSFLEQMLRYAKSGLMIKDKFLGIEKGPKDIFQTLAWIFLVKGSEQFGFFRFPWFS